MNQKFGVGDIVKVRQSEELCRVVMPIQDEDGSWWYEIEAVDFNAPFNREVKQDDLRMA